MRLHTTRGKKQGSVRRVRHLFLPECYRVFGGFLFPCSVFFCTVIRLLDIYTYTPDGLAYLLKHCEVPDVLYLLDMSGGSVFTGALVLCLCSLPAAALFAEDYQSNALLPRILRMGAGRYTLSRVAFAMASAWLCRVMAELACGLCLVCFFGGYWCSRLGVSWLMESSLLYHMDPGVYTLVLVARLGLEAAFYSLLTVLVSIILPRRQILTAVPLVMQYAVFYLLWQLSFIPDILQPAAVYGSRNMEADLLETGAWESLGIIFLYTAAVGILCGMALFWRIRHGRNLGGMQE